MPLAKLDIISLCTKYDSSSFSGGAENAGVENAGVENTGAKTYGKPLEHCHIMLLFRAAVSVLSWTLLSCWKAVTRAHSALF